MSAHAKTAVEQVEHTDAQWHKDMPAYKALRDQGLQPPRIDNCYELATRASSQFEIEMGTVVPKHHHSRVQEGLAISKEMERPMVGTRPSAS